MGKLVQIIHAPPSSVRTPPLGLVYLKNYLEKRKVSVGVNDLNLLIFKRLGFSKKTWLSLNEQFEKSLFRFVERRFPEILKNFYRRIKNAEFIAFSLFKRNAPFSFALAGKIKDKFPNKKIIFGGPHTLFLEHEGSLDPRSYWVIGEGEKALYEIITRPRRKISSFDEVKCLDRLPFLDFSPLKTNLYSNSLPLLSSRGCPYQCNFCAERRLFKTFRFHSPRYLIDQIKYLVRKHKVNNFTFCDSLINYRNQWLKDFCSLLIKNNLKIKWEAQVRVDKNLTKSLARLIKKSGCYSLFVGLESGSDSLLRAMNKGINTASAIRFFKIMSDAGLHFEISIIFGYPGETDTHFQQTLDFILKNKKIIPKIAQVNPFVDYLGNFSPNSYSSALALKRVKRFLQILENNKIRYTKSFINNLIYGG